MWGGAAPLCASQSQAHGMEVCEVGHPRSSRGRCGTRLVSDQLWLLTSCVTSDRLLSLSECPSPALGPGNNISREGTVEFGPEAGLGQGPGSPHDPLLRLPSKGGGRSIN